MSRLALCFLLAGCVAAPRLPAPGEPEITYVTSAGDQVRLDPDGGCLELVHVPGSKGGHSILLRNDILVPNGLAALPRVMQREPRAARAARSSARLGTAGVVLAWIGVATAPLIGGAFAARADQDSARTVDALIAGGAAGAALLAGGIAMLLASQHVRDRAISTYNAWAVVHGCDDP